VGDPCVVFVVLISVVGVVGNCCLWLCVVLSSILFVFSRLIVGGGAFLWCGVWRQLFYVLRGSWIQNLTYLVCSSRSKDAKYSSLQSSNPGMCFSARHNCCNIGDGKGSPLSKWPLIRSTVFWSYNLQSTSILFAAAYTIGLNNNNNNKRNISRGLSFAITLLHSTYPINKRAEQNWVRISNTWNW
jgi:hypothetical protein